MDDERSESDVPPMLERAYGIPFRALDGRWTLGSVDADASGELTAEDVAMVRAAQTRAQLRAGIKPTDASDPKAREDAALSSAWHARRARDREDPFAEILKRAMQVGTAAPPTRGVRAKGLEPGVAPLDDARMELLMRRTDARIPPVFRVCPAGCKWAERGTSACKCGKRFVHVAWKHLAWLENKVGQPSFGGIETETDDPGDVGHLLEGEEAVEELQRRLARAGGESVLFFGPPRAGKSLSAAAYANALIESGEKGVLWCRAIDLQNPRELDRAMSAKTVFLDDMGAEFNGARADSDYAARRAAPVTELIRDIADNPSRRLVVSTYMTLAKAAAMYDGGIATRVFEGAEIIYVGRSARPSGDLGVRAPLNEPRREGA